MTERREDQHQRFLDTPPSPEQLTVVAREVGGAASVVGVRRLPGGIASAVHRVDLSNGTSVVVRRFNAELPWHSTERIEREARLLQSLETTPVPAPRVLFADPRGEATGCPMLVLELLAGASIDPPGDDRWAHELATSLALVHDEEAPFDAEPWLTFWVDRDELPQELVGHDLSEAVWDGVVRSRRSLVDAPRALAHHDFHPGNTLWSDGKVTGIVDWPLGGRGYVDYDAVYCAFDISLSKGLDTGERFLRAYESITGRTPHAGWRLVVATRALDELDDWLDAYVGVGSAITLPELRANFRAWVTDGLRRVA